MHILSQKHFQSLFFFKICIVYMLVYSVAVFLFANLSVNCCVSLSVAAAKFSSVQQLETRGRNFSVTHVNTHKQLLNVLHKDTLTCRQEKLLVEPPTFFFHIFQSEDSLRAESLSTHCRIKASIVFFSKQNLLSVNVVGLNKGPRDSCKVKKSLLANDKTCFSSILTVDKPL